MAISTPSPVITIIVIMSPFARVTVHGVPSSDDAYSQVVTTILYPIYIGSVKGHDKSKRRIRKWLEKSNA